MSDTELSSAVEDYLKTIYKLQAEEGKATVGAVASQLEVAPPSVTGMFQALAEKGLIRYEPYKGARLTGRGRRLGLSVIRRHRLTERFLEDVLDVPWEELHAEADRWEHVLSRSMEARMDAVLGNPGRDPHGAPIPTVEGDIEERAKRSLSDLEVGPTAVVGEVSDHDPDLLRYLDRAGLRPGVQVKCLRRDPYGGSLTVLVEGVERSLGPEAARQVWLHSLGSESAHEAEDNLKDEEVRR